VDTRPEMPAGGAPGFGAPRATAVLAVLGYRIVNYWLPLLRVPSPTFASG
jgi:hypothetical protein